MSGRQAIGPVPKDEHARREVRRGTDKSILVEAAAGTGKTTLIVDRILQAVRTGAVSLARTVAITFTEKAAGELETRLRAALDKAVRCRDLANDERTNLLNAVEELDRAQISTIHAFCAHMLREKAVEAGVDPGFAVLDETAARLLVQRCWESWMDRQVSDAPAVLAEALRAGARIADLAGLARALVGSPEAMEGDRFDPARPNESAEEIALLRQAAADAADAFERHMTTRSNKDSRALLEKVYSVLAAEVDDTISLRRLAYRIAGTNLAAVLKSFRADAREEAGQALQPLVEAADRIGGRLACDVFVWLQGFVHHYAEAKRERSVVDFQDLLALSARALRRDPGLRRYFQRRYDAFFVDEFQDTDPLQAELIAYLCEGTAGPAAERMTDVRIEDGRLLAVGDPKQSIYRFRRADVRVYDLFKRLFGAERVKLLSCNFRSSRPLLDWFNRLFECIFSMELPAGARQADHVPLAPGRETEEPPGPSVVGFYPPPGLGAEEWNAGAARRHEAHFLARAVRDLVEGTGGPPGWQGRMHYGDFAFLFRALTDVGAYEDALNRYGVPYRVVGSKHFYRREQVAETLALLRAVDDPLDEAAVVGALRSSYFGLSDEDLFRYREQGGRWTYLLIDDASGPVADAMGLLAAWHRRRNRVPPQVLLGEILDVTKAREAFRLKPAGAQRAANLEKLVADLRQLAPAVGTFTGLVAHLSTVQEAGLPETESSILEPGDDFVQLLTMHKAKGLEFRAVVLPDLHRRFPGPSQVSALLFNRLDGRIGLRLTGAMRSPLYDELAAEERADDVAELHRLLYVACTRAQQMLVVPLGWATKRLGECFQTVLLGTGLFAGPDAVPYGALEGGVYYYDTRTLVDRVDVSARPVRVSDGGRADVDDLVRRRDRWLEVHGSLGERASAAEPCVLPSAMAGEHPPDAVAAASLADEGGVAFGTLFHNLMGLLPLERAEEEGFSELAASLAGVEAGRLGLGEPAAEGAAELVLASVRRREFQELLDGAEAVRKEAALSVPLARLPGCDAAGPGFVEGSIDLLLRSPGATVILDYKTDRVDGQNTERAAERYWMQLALYGLAARACGWADGDVELVLFFVRQGALVRRRLDGQLAAEAAELIGRRAALQTE